MPTRRFCLLEPEIGPFPTEGDSLTMWRTLVVSTPKTPLRQAKTPGTAALRHLDEKPAATPQGFEGTEVRSRRARIDAGLREKRLISCE